MRSREINLISVKGPPNFWETSTHKPILINYLTIWLASMCSTWLWPKKNFRGKKSIFLNCTAIHENKRSWSIRNQDPWVGRSKLNQLCFRDRHQILADKNRHGVMYCHKMQKSRGIEDPQYMFTALFGGGSKKNCNYLWVSEQKSCF